MDSGDDNYLCTEDIGSPLGHTQRERLPLDGSRRADVEACGGEGCGTVAADECRGGTGETTRAYVVGVAADAAEAAAYAPIQLLSAQVEHGQSWSVQLQVPKPPALNFRALAQLTMPAASSGDRAGPSRGLAHFNFICQLFAAVISLQLDDRTGVMPCFTCAQVHIEMALTSGDNESTHGHSAGERADAEVAGLQMDTGGGASATITSRVLQPMFSFILPPRAYSSSRDELVEWLKLRKENEEAVKERCNDGKEDIKAVLKSVKNLFDDDLLETLCEVNCGVMKDDLTDEFLLEQINAITDSYQNRVLLPVNELFKKELRMDMNNKDITARVTNYFMSCNTLIKKSTEQCYEIVQAHLSPGAGGGYQSSRAGEIKKFRLESNKQQSKVVQATEASADDKNKKDRACSGSTFAYTSHCVYEEAAIVGVVPDDDAEDDVEVGADGVPDGDEEDDSLPGIVVGVPDDEDEIDSVVAVGDKVDDWIVLESAAATLSRPKYAISPASFMNDVVAVEWYGGQDGLDTWR
ncbi:hypothetical protein ON010_g14370 [Phytophthora cinnamomi]|nr:hypothetical protein ON010_g14370 [Phytophthora cinnamomi]